MRGTSNASAHRVLPDGETIGRYVVLGKAGAGGALFSRLERLLAKAQGVGDDRDGAEAHRGAG